MKKIENSKSTNKKEVVSDVCLFCDAPCCKENFVPLTLEEAKSGRYEAVFLSIFDFNTKKVEEGYFLKRKKDGSCVYLNEVNLCTIWRERPKACRIYICEKIKEALNH
ncbi:MAG: YkgJ family cysteine cluster protein [Caldisericia bacterium]|jgi:Fe-S-cluster containining protein|nr:YkgJ family cysteine cluster protein [Caldisericia bacterium]